MGKGRFKQVYKAFDTQVGRLEGGGEGGVGMRGGPWRGWRRAAGGTTQGLFAAGSNSTLWGVHPLTMATYRYVP